MAGWPNNKRADRALCIVARMCVRTRTRQYSVINLETLAREHDDDVWLTHLRRECVNASVCP